MSSSSAWNTAASGVLAAVTSSHSGNPVPSAARWSLHPGLARSTGFAPVWSPPNRAQAKGVHGDPRPVERSGRAELVQQQPLQSFEHPGPGPLGKPPPATRHTAAAELTDREQRPRGGGAGHEQDRSHAGPVRDGSRCAAAGVGWRGWQQGWMRCHSASAGSRSARVVMAQIIAHHRPARSYRAKQGIATG
jgi:hypothetical protein